MSVVVAKVTNNKIYISADSITVQGWTKVNSGTNHTKLIKYNNLIIGGCGRTEEISLIFHYIKTHMPQDCSEKAILDFIIEFKRWKNDLTGSSDVNNEYIIAYKGKCFGIQRMLVYEIIDYGAIGAGMDYALGALHQGASSKEAVKAACDLCAFVAEPILTEVMDREAVEKINEISIN